MVSTRRIIGKVKRKWVPTRPLKLAEFQQLTKWRAGKNVLRPDFVKLASQQDRLSRIVIKRARFGRNIGLQQLSSVPKSGFERAEFEKIQTEIQKKWGARFSSQKIASLLAKAKVLQASLALSTQLGGRKPTVYQMLAFTALRYGLNSAQLTEQAIAMKTIWAHNRSRVTWDGTPTNIYFAIRKILPNGKLLLPEMERTLFEFYKTNPKIAMDSKMLCDKLGLPWSRQNNVSLNYCLQLLEVSGLVKKMPMLSGQLSVWSHCAFKNPPINYSNLDMTILQELNKSNVTKVSQLYKLRVFNMKNQKSFEFGNPKIKFNRRNVLLKVAILEKYGLIETQKQKIETKTKKGQSGKIAVRVAKLTPLGKQLMLEHDANNSLPEWGRKLLLGEKE